MNFYQANDKLMTYAADKPQVMAALKAMTDQGKYPADGLWK